MYLSTASLWLWTHEESPKQEAHGPRLSIVLEHCLLLTAVRCADCESNVHTSSLLPSPLPLDLCFINLLLSSPAFDETGQLMSLNPDPSFSHAVFVIYL